MQLHVQRSVLDHGTHTFAVMPHFVDMVVIYGTCPETKFATVHKLFLIGIHCQVVPTALMALTYALEPSPRVIYHGIGVT